MRWLHASHHDQESVQAVTISESIIKVVVRMSHAKPLESQSHLSHVFRKLGILSVQKEKQF